MKKIFNRTLAMIMSATMILSQALPTAAEESASTALSIEEAVEEKTETEAEDKASKETSNENVPLDEQPKDEQEVSEDDNKDKATDQDSKEEKETSEASEHTEEKSDDKSNEDVEEKEEAASDIEIRLLEMPQEQSEYILEQYGEDVLNTYDITVPEGTEFPVQITFSADVSDDQAVTLFHYTGDEWEEITPDEVDEGSITATFNSLSPVAVVDVAEEDDAEGTEITAEYKVNNEDAGYIEDNTAIANEYYEFVNWTSEDGEEVSAEPCFVAENDGVYTANFEAVTYTIEYKAADGGTVSTESEEATIESGVTGAVAEADEGYLFVNWTSEDEAVVSEDAEFIPELKDGIYTANFKEEGYVVTYKTMLTEDSIVPEDGLFGTAFVNDTEETEERSKDAFTGATATASDGYRFVNWVDADGNEVSNKFTLIPSEVTEDAIYTAVFESIFVNTELSAEAGEQIITATGAMPRGAELVAEKITYVKPVEETVNGSLVDQVQFTAFHAFDIKIMVDGEEWQPVDDNARVTITISGTRISEVEESDSVKVKVYRVEDDNENTTDMSATIVNSDTVSFETEHFTVYTVGSTDYDSSDATNSWDISASQNGSIMAYWYEDDALLIITGSGKMKNYLNYGTTSLSPIYENLGSTTFSVEWVNADGLTSIGDNVFFNCTGLTLTSLPDGITSIGEATFYSCPSLALTSLPESLTSIGHSAFYDCTSLALTNLPDGITSIGNSAFFRCTNLALTALSSNLSSIGNSAFYGCVSLNLTSLPSSLSSIGSSAFRGCSGLTSIDLSACSELTELFYWTFSGCSNLSYVNLSGLTKLRSIKQAFEGQYNEEHTTNLTIDLSNCSSLEDIYCTFYQNKNLYDIDLTGTNIKKLPDGTFTSCTNLEIVKLPLVLEAISDDATTNLAGAFYNCSKLREINIEECTLLTHINQESFRGCKELAFIEFPDSVVYIGESAFSVCTKLSSISLPPHLTEIGGNAFSNCDNLIITNFPIEIETIGFGAFNSCPSLEIIDLSYRTGLTSIGERAFQGCKKIRKVDLTGCTTLSSIGSRAFSSISTSTDDGAAIHLTNCASLVSLNNTFTSSKIKSVDLKGTSIETIPASFFFFGYNTTLTEVQLPSTIKTIGTSAFRSQKNLSNVNFGELTALESIGDDAFNGCDHLTEIDFSPSILEQIGTSAFANCYSITAIKLPSSVISIGDKAFYACPNLTEIEATGSATLGTSVFSPSDYVPSGVNVFYNYFLDGTYHSYEVPIRTTLTGDADWFDTYDFKGDYRVMGDYTVTLPMSIELKYNGTDFGTTEYEVANDTNDWPIMVSLWDTSNPYHSGSLNMSDESGHTIKLLSSDITYNTDWSDSVGKFADKTGEKTITFTSNEVITSEIAYTGSLTFKTGIIVE